MLEALVAISLAGNVLQFAHSASKLVALTRQIHKTGSVSSLDELEASVTQLASQIELINQRICASPPNGSQTPEEVSLQNLAVQCQQSNNEFLQLLHKLQRKSSPPKVFTSLRQSIKIFIASETLSDYATKIESFKDALQLAALLSLRTGVGERFDSIEHHLLLLQGSVEKQRQLQAVVDLDYVRNDLLDAIHQSDTKIDVLQHSIEENAVALENLVKAANADKAVEMLRWLGFRQMHHRFDEIPVAQRKTFEWIFESHLRTTNWSSLVGYLESSQHDGCYWINGKAGAGKSSLMKFVVEHPSTSAALAKWSGSMKLVAPSFFFWSLGTKLQKTYTGMLRAILHKILEQYQELVPVVFPHLWSNWTVAEQKTEPKYIEVKSALELLIVKASFLNICLFIDGVDEFNGDYREMSLFLRQICSERIKVVVSSRPLNECRTAFSNCATLQLEHLTRNDILTYVEQNLRTHRHMHDLMLQEPQRASKIVMEITDKANGVFIWVKMVVKALIDGLENGDFINDLEQKLRATPADVKALYDRMLTKISPMQRSQAAQIFCLLRHWNEQIAEEPLGIAFLAYALERPLSILEMENGPLSVSEITLKCKTTEARVRSRCCGLLDVYRPSKHQQVSYCFGVKDPSLAEAGFDRMQENLLLINASVGYIHRTVAEFLHVDDIWEGIMHSNQPQSSDPSTALALSCLLSLKSQSAGKSYEEIMIAINRITIFLRYGCNLSNLDLLRVVSSIDRLMQEYCASPNGTGSQENNTHWSNLVTVRGRAVTSSLITAENLREFCRASSLVTFAARSSLLCFLKLQAWENRSDLLPHHVVVLHALQSWLDEQLAPPLANRISTLQYLLSNVSSLYNGYGVSNFSYAIKVAMLLVQDRPFDCATLLELILTMDTVPPSHSMIPDNEYYEVIEEVNSIVRCLKSSSVSAEGVPPSLFTSEEMMNLINRLDKLLLDDRKFRHEDTPIRCVSPDSIQQDESSIDEEEASFFSSGSHGQHNLQHETYQIWRRIVSTVKSLVLAVTGSEYVAKSTWHEIIKDFSPIPHPSPLSHWSPGLIPFDRSSHNYDDRPAQSWQPQDSRCGQRFTLPRLDQTGPQCCTCYEHDLLARIVKQTGELYDMIKAFDLLIFCQKWAAIQLAIAVLGTSNNLPGSRRTYTLVDRWSEIVRALHTAQAVEYSFVDMLRESEATLLDTGDTLSEIHPHREEVQQARIEDAVAETKKVLSLFQKDLSARRSEMQRYHLRAIEYYDDCAQL